MFKGQPSGARNMDDRRRRRDDGSRLLESLLTLDPPERSVDDLTESSGRCSTRTCLQVRGDVPIGGHRRGAASIRAPSALPPHGMRRGC
jgi:hypothetical protein